MNSPGLLLSKSFNMVSTSTFYAEKLHRKAFWNFLEVKMGWNLGPFSLKKLPRYKIPLTVASTIFQWLHIIKRLGCQVNIWSNSFKKSPENLLKRRNITSKSANQKKRRLPSKKHQFCAFYTNCLAVDWHLYCYVSPLPFFLAKTFIIDKNVFFCVFPL